MRGKRWEKFTGKKAVRITPADAGKTRRRGFISRLHGDHPRGCGENPGLRPPPPAVVGSPPRMRGKLRTFKRPCNRLRITPADAGKTDSRNVHG